MRIRTALATAVLALLPLAASAQQAPMTEGLTAVAPGKFAGLVETRATLVVDSIDKATRSVVLRNAKGETTKVVAGDEVKNFDQIKGNRSPPLNNLRHRVKFYVIIYVT